MVLQKRIAKEEIQMQISLLLMQQIAQLFLILLMGYAVVKTGLLKASDSKVLSVVFVYLVMPCVVLNAFQIKDTPEIRTGLLYSMGIAVGMHVVFLLLNALFRKVLKLDAVEQVNIIYSNAAACATVTSMAQLYDRDASHSSAIYVLSTLLSILTMPLMIGLFELLL
jgi:predicted permease